MATAPDKTDHPPSHTKTFTKAALLWIERELRRDRKNIREPFAPNTNSVVRWNTTENIHRGIGLTDAPVAAIDFLRPTIGFTSSRALRNLARDGDLPPEGVPCLYAAALTRAGPSASITKTELLERFENAKTVFMANCPEVDGLRTAVRQLVLPQTVDKIICFGLGCMTPSAKTDDDEEGVDNIADSIEEMEFCASAVEQHALAWLIGNKFLVNETALTKPPKIYVQDPGYSSLCKEVLRENDMEVVECFGGRGFAMVDADTIVIAKNASCPVREIISEVTNPAAMCWRPPRTLEEVEGDEEEYLEDDDTPWTLEWLRTRYVTVEWPSRSALGTKVAANPNVWCYRKPEELDPEASTSSDAKTKTEAEKVGGED